MKSLIVAAMMVLPVLCMGGEAEVSVSLDVASAYIFRGSTFNDGVVAQPGVEVSGLPVMLGVWGNLDLDDYGGAVANGEFQEIDLYASYDLPLSIDPVEISVGYTEYLYPSGGGPADREVSLSASLGVLLSPSLGVYYGVDGGIQNSFYAEVGLSHEIAISDDVSLEIGALIAYLDPDEGESGFSHADLSAGVSYGVLNAGVNYIAQIDDDVLPDVEDGGGYDTEVVVKVGVAYNF